MITYSFNGTSHGEGYCGTISGLPDGFVVDVAQVNKQLQLRKCGFGRSTRQTFGDSVTFEGAQNGKLTVRGDVKFFVPNAKTEQRAEITALRSGHVDVVGLARYPQLSTRALNEIASARNSVCYVVVGAICKQILQLHGVFTYSYTQQIGNVKSRAQYIFGKTENHKYFALLRCPSKIATNKMAQLVEQMRNDGNSLGGVSVVCATGVPCGLGDVFPYEDRLDGKLAGSFMAIPSVKSVEFGLGKNYAEQNGVKASDVLCVCDGLVKYQTNNCGGIVGGITTGNDIVCSLTVKPVPTVKNTFTIDKLTKQTVPSHYERADTCVVANVGIIAENILATVLVNQMTKQNLL